MPHYEQPRRPKQAWEIIQAIGKTAEFLVKVNDENKKGRLTFDDYTEQKRVLAGIALTVAPDIVKRMRNAKGVERYECQKTWEQRQLELMATIPDWLNAKKKLDASGKSMLREEKIQTLRPVVAFNKIVREMIDMEQYRTISQVKAFVGSTLLSVGYNKTDIDYAEQVTRRTLNGMRHEVAAESVLSSLSEVEDINSGSEEDEFVGKDIIVKYNGVVVGIDIKASKAAAKDANQRAWEHHDMDYVAIWSGFTNEEFGDNLLPSKEQLKEKKGYYWEVMDQIVEQRQPRGVAFSA